MNKEKSLELITEIEEKLTALKEEVEKEEEEEEE